MSKNRHPLAQLTLVRYREFVREPEALFWALLFPILLAIGLGIAFRNRPPDVLNVAAVTQELAHSLRQESQLAVELLPVEDAEDRLRTGGVALVAEPGADGGVVYHYDDTNPDGRSARILADRAVQRAAGRADPVASNDEIMREAGSRYIDFLIPGLVGMGLMGNAIWGTGFAIVDARRKKLIKRMVATPMPRHYYLLSFILSRLSLLVIEVGLIIAFGVVAFGVPVRGSFAGLVLLCVLGSLTFSAIGLLIAARTQTIEGASGLMNAVMLPMWILSGIFFSSERFPEAVQPVVRALPLTAAIDALRAHMLQGAGLAQVAPEMGVMGAWMIASFAVALKLFRWR